MRQALILAAGEGRRLRPFTVNRPKAMIRIAGKPIIQFVIEALASNGIRDIVLVVGYKREQIIDCLGDGKQLGVSINYIVQNKQLGTAQALHQARDFADNEFLVLPGDKLISPQTIAGLETTRPEAVLVEQVTDSSRYGVVTVDKGYIVQINEKPTTSYGNLVNTGIYIFTKNIFNFTFNKLDIPDVINELVSRGISIAAVETDKPWLDVVYPWDIIQLNRTILEKATATRNGVIESGVSIRGQVSLGKNTVIRGNSYIVGPAVIGDNCDIGPQVCIFPSTSIANNVKIGPFTRIVNSVIGDNVAISAGSDIEDSMIDDGCIIGSNFCALSEETEIRVDWQVFLAKTGAMIGEGCKIGSLVVAQPGAIVGNYCNIKSQKIIKGLLTDKSIVV